MYTKTIENSTKIKYFIHFFEVFWLIGQTLGLYFEEKFFQKKQYFSFLVFSI